MTVGKKKLSRTRVRERVIATAIRFFMEKGIRPVRMDDIAAALSISKRTLYELFSDKETLLLEVMKCHRKGVQDYMSEVAGTTDNVLEMLFKFYERTVNDLQHTHRSFFDDLKRYPRVQGYIEESRRENAAAVIDFYQKGVRQGIFRDDLHYDIVQDMVHRQMDVLIRPELSSSYSLVDIYHTFIFMHMRGISTEKGWRMIDDFLGRKLREHLTDRNE